MLSRWRRASDPNAAYNYPATDPTTSEVTDGPINPEVEPASFGRGPFNKNGFGPNLGPGPINHKLGPIGFGGPNHLNGPGPFIGANVGPFNNGPNHFGRFNGPFHVFDTTPLVPIGHAPDKPIPVPGPFSIGQCRSLYRASAS